MRWGEGFIAVDWGTTNRRAYALDAGGAVGERLEDDLGILSVPDGGFPGLIGELRDRFGNRPMLLAGMIGSNRGWHEAPYVSAPARLADLVGGLWREDGQGCVIVPGVCYQAGGDADVMRGEEVQLLGAAEAGLAPRDGLVCHPGTHAKWAWMADGAIVGFTTMMTGELFNLLRQHSILADLLREEAEDDDAFAEGVRHGLARDDLVSELFSVRARVLLGMSPREDRASYISGLLIGQDVRLGLRCGTGEGIVTVMGKPELTRLYARAIETAGRGCREVDGEEAFLAGARRLAEMLR